jgi:predicted MPP superfamily phosphohydrolase
MNLRDLLASLAGMALFGAVTYARRVGPQAVQVNPLMLMLPRLSPAFDGYRVVQISDIHFGSWMTPQRFSRIISLINEQQPDLVAITGDFVTNHQPYDPDALADVLRQLQTRDGTVAILGNHDHRHEYGVGAMQRILQESGIIELCNRVHTISRAGAVLHIAGVDDVSMLKSRLDLVLPQIPAEGAAILLAHEPDFAAISVPVGRFDLQISGHTHGGQVIIPGLGPLALPRFGMRYPVGLYRVDGMYVYTNRGIGVGNIRARLNCPPEITVFTLRAPRASAYN